MWTTVAPCRRFSPVGTPRSSGGRRRSRSSTVWRLACSASSGSSARNVCMPASTSRPFEIAVLKELAPHRRERAAGRRDADERRRRRRSRASRRHARRSGCPRYVSPARVESRIGDGRMGRVADDAPHRLAVVRHRPNGPRRGSGSASRRTPGREPEGRLPSPGARRAAGRRRRARRPARDPRRGGGSRRGRRGRRGSRRGRPRRSPGRTRPCSRSSRPGRVPGRHAPSGSPRATPRSSRA